ncbi:monooxygenase [Ciceribacter ferrooxidans]|uniref:Monooxygenase n=1 Tax=Ciceribacter ferrooxidans TaxID=2509717 RepID=A0A4Q2T545_9HYPH|nr:monooxygenase [Ciceribacter ferrooxidans]RYC12008.1 monooxygenase [Ciceribacter ferrooxidans]
MAALLQIDFPFEGPWGDAMTEALSGLAADIASEEGLLWKIWTENPAERRAGGIYLFTDAENAARYAEKHGARLKGFGIDEIACRSFAVNPGLSAITRATL